MAPYRVLKDAIRAVPAVKYALGVAGIAAVVSIVEAYRTDLRISVIGALITIILMVILVLFARLSTLAASRFHLPALVFTWFSLVLLISTSILLFTSVFFAWPLNLTSWLSVTPRLGIVLSTARSKQSEHLPEYNASLPQANLEPVLTASRVLLSVRSNASSSVSSNTSIELHVDNRSTDAILLTDIYLRSETTCAASGATSKVSPEISKQEVEFVLKRTSEMSQTQLITVVREEGSQENALLGAIGWNPNSCGPAPVLHIPTTIGVNSGTLKVVRIAFTWPSITPGVSNKELSLIASLRNRILSPIDSVYVEVRTSGKHTLWHVLTKN